MNENEITDGDRWQFLMRAIVDGSPEMQLMDKNCKGMDPPERLEAQAMTTLVDTCIREQLGQA